MPPRFSNFNGMQSFGDRLRFYFGVCSPARWFDSDSEIDAAKRLLRRYCTGALSNCDPERLEEAERLTATAVNPESNNTLPTLARRSLFAPVNCCVYLAQFVAGGTWQRDVFWQLSNQSYNAYLNYANGSDPSQSQTDDAVKFGSAIFGSCGATLAARLSVQRLIAMTSTFTIQNGAVARGGGAVLLSAVLPPLIGNLVGNYINLSAIRADDMKNGIPVRTLACGSAQEVGVSAIAGSKAFEDTITSRTLLIGGSMLGLTVAPALVLPRNTPLLQDWLANKTHRAEDWVKRNLPRWSSLIMKTRLRPHFPLFLGLYLAFSGVVLTTVLPLSLAPFQYYLELDAYELEPEIAAKAKAGVIPRTLYAYRGM